MCAELGGRFESRLADLQGYFVSGCLVIGGVPEKPGGILGGSSSPRHAGIQPRLAPFLLQFSGTEMFAFPTPGVIKEKTPAHPLTHELSPDLRILQACPWSWPERPK